MKKLKIFTSVFLLSLCLMSFGQTAKNSSKMNTYFVLATHTPDQCMNTLMEMKGKGDSYLSKFEFGCMSGDHTGYAFLQGTSEENVRKMLPKDMQAGAKIQQVGKFSSAQIEQMHKEHSK